MKNSIKLIFFIIILTACKKEQKTEIDTKKDDDVLMISPAKNEVCETGIETSKPLVSINFNWKSIERERNYILHVRSLYSDKKETTQFVVNDTTHSLILRENIAYAWYVVGMGNQKKLPEEWNFYVSGNKTTNVPAPAEAIQPLQGGIVYYRPNGIDLNWYAHGQDIKCDLYFGTNKNPPLIKENSPIKGYSNFFSENVMLEKGKTHYWKVVTKNNDGNISISPIFQFNNI